MNRWIDRYTVCTFIDLNIPMTSWFFPIASAVGHLFDQTALPRLSSWAIVVVSCGFSKLRNDGNPGKMVVKALVNHGKNLVEY